MNNKQKKLKQISFKCVSQKLENESFKTPQKIIKYKFVHKAFKQNKFWKSIFQNSKKNDFNLSQMKKDFFEDEHLSIQNPQLSLDPITNFLTNTPETKPKLNSISKRKTDDFLKFGSPLIEKKTTEKKKEKFDNFLFLSKKSESLISEEDIRLDLGILISEKQSKTNKSNFYYFQKIHNDNLINPNSINKSTQNEINLNCIDAISWEKFEKKSKKVFNKNKIFENENHLCFLNKYNNNYISNKKKCNEEFLKFQKTHNKNKNLSLVLNSSSMTILKRCRFFNKDLKNEKMKIRHKSLN